MFCNRNYLNFEIMKTIKGINAAMSVLNTAWKNGNFIKITTKIEMS